LFHALAVLRHEFERQPSGEICKSLDGRERHMWQARDKSAQRIFADTITQVVNKLCRRRTPTLYFSHEQLMNSLHKLCKLIPKKSAALVDPRRLRRKNSRLVARSPAQLRFVSAGKGLSIGQFSARWPQRNNLGLCLVRELLLFFPVRQATAYIVRLET